jgi:acyl carrier protein
MTSRNIVVQLVLDALIQVNAGRAPDLQIPVSPESRLFGANSHLDSLELVNLILDVEDQVGRTFSLPIILMDERAMSQERSPFRSVTTLTDYIVQLLEEQQHG